MQGHARASDLSYQRIATRVDFIQVGRTKWLVSRSGKNEVGHLEIAHWTVVRRCKRVEFFCYAQRRLANFVIRTNISHDDWINRIAEDHECVVAHFNRIRATGKCARHHDERIGRANQETEFF